MGDTDLPDDDERVASRSELLDEERVVGSDDAVGQASAILGDSEARTLDREASPGTVTEHRHSEDTVDPTAGAT
jgi:hypothetical protein